VGLLEQRLQAPGLLEQRLQAPFLGMAPQDILGPLL
jgi:hypothetical protein